MFKTKFWGLMLLLTGIYSQSSAQQISNVSLTTTDDKVIVSYDLNGKKSAIYDVSLNFKMADGKKITPKSLNGDYGKVSAGTGKAIIWDLYKDVNGLSGAIEPELKASEVLAQKRKNKPAPTPTPPAPKKPTIDIDMNKDKRFSNTMRTGFKISLGNSSVESNLRRDKFQRKFSYEVGSFFRWHKHLRFYIQPEILYHFQQYEERFNLEENAISRHHSIRAQALAGVAPFGMGLYINGGIYYGYLLGGSEKQYLETETINRNFEDFEAMNGESLPFNRHDVGFILGGSISIKKGAFALGVLYSQGFESFINNPYYKGDSENENLQLKNRGVHFFIQRAF